MIISNNAMEEEKDVYEIISLKKYNKQSDYNIQNLMLEDMNEELK